MQQHQAWIAITHRIPRGYSGLNNFHCIWRAGPTQACSTLLHPCSASLSLCSLEQSTHCSLSGVTWQVQGLAVRAVRLVWSVRAVSEQFDPQQLAKQRASSCLISTLPDIAGPKPIYVADDAIKALLTHSVSAEQATPGAGCNFGAEQVRADFFFFNLLVSTEFISDPACS